MTNSVWLFTRPLRYAVRLPPIASISDGKPHLRHWGVLVSKMSHVDMKATLSRIKEYCGSDFSELGTMYELFRDDGDRNNVSICRNFGMKTIRDEWPMYSAEFVGLTTMKHDLIKKEGNQPIEGQVIVAAGIVKERPDYRLFENNCQNFVTYLLAIICPDAAIPDTIQTVLQRLQDISNTVSSHGSILPGTYPASISTTSFTVSSGTTWFTASSSSWVTAASISSPNMTEVTVEAELCEIIARIVVKSILVAMQIVQYSGMCLGTGNDERDYKARLNKQIVRLDDVHQLLKNPVIGEHIQARDRHTFFYVLKGLHALLLGCVKSKGPQTEAAKQFCKNMSAKGLITEFEENDLESREMGETEEWLRRSEILRPTVLRKRDAERFILDVEQRVDVLDQLVSETIPPILALNQPTMAHNQKAMPSENLTERQVNPQILVEKNREESVISSMEGLSLGFNSTELHVSQVRLLQDRSSGTKEYNFGDEYDDKCSDLGGSSRRKWAQFFDTEGHLLHDRVIVEFKEPDPIAIREEKRRNEVRLQLRYLVRELRLASRSTTEAKPFQVLYCLGFCKMEDGYGIVYLPPSSNTYDICESLGNILLKENYRRVFEKTFANRLHLAKALAFTIYSLHSIQWVHRTIKPDNILIFGSFTTDREVKFDWTSPYIVGFDAARPNLACDDRIPASIRWENRVYAHPHTQRNGDSGIKRFSKQYDIYSLGVVLLEIGQMKCFKDSEYRKSRAWTDISAKEVQDKLLLLAEELRGIAGETFSKIVVRCLDGFPDFNDWDDVAGTALSALFRSRVCEMFDQIM